MNKDDQLETPEVEMLRLLLQNARMVRRGPREDLVEEALKWERKFTALLAEIHEGPERPDKKTKLLMKQAA